ARVCRRGASFPCYAYSPASGKLLFILGDMCLLLSVVGAQGYDQVEASGNIENDLDKRAQYVKARGKGGFVRTNWQEACEIIASACIHTIKAYGPDRIVGFSPIPAMSMVSYAGGARFLSLLGGTLLSFYDWYAALPPASPQVWGDQT